MRPEYYYMGVIAPSFVLLPLLAGLAGFAKLPAPGKMLVFYLVFETCISGVSTWLAMNQQSNLRLYHFSTIAETLLLLLFFYQVFSQARIKKIISWLMIVFPLLCVLNFLYLQPLTAFNSYALSLKSLLMIALCFLYWWHQDQTDGQSWGSQPVNWILSGLLLYFSSSFILFTFSNVIIAATSKNISLLLWNIHATLTIIMYVLMAIGIIRYKKS